MIFKLFGGFFEAGFIDGKPILHPPIGMRGDVLQGSRHLKLARRGFLIIGYPERIGLIQAVLKRYFTNYQGDFLAVVFKAHGQQPLVALGNVGLEQKLFGGKRQGAGLAAFAAAG
jgi:hypothetical protein